MKKLISVLLVVMVLMLSACKGKDEPVEIIPAADDASVSAQEIQDSESEQLTTEKTTDKKVEKSTAKTTKKATTTKPIVKKNNPISATDSELAKSIKRAGGDLKINNTSYKANAEIMSKLKSTVSKYGNTSGFYVVDVKTNASMFHNADALFNTGSAIKCPYVLYVCSEIEAGNINPNEKLTYTQKYYREGSGVIKDYGTKSYTVKEIIHYTIHDSDNSAYYMLFDRFGNKGFNAMLDKLGVVNMHLYGGYRYAKTSPRDMAIVWAEVKNFINGEGGEMGKFLKQEFTNARYNQLGLALPNETVLHKGGWISGSYIDTGMVVTQEGTYLIGVFTNSSGGEADKQFLINITKQLDKLMKDFYKSDAAKPTQATTEKTTSIIEKIIGTTQERTTQTTTEKTTVTTTQEEVTTKQVTTAPPETTDSGSEDSTDSWLDRIFN